MDGSKDKCVYNFYLKTLRENQGRGEHIILSHIKLLDTGFGLVIEFIGLLQTITTSNYSAVANSHTLLFTTARTRSSVCCVFSGCRLVIPPMP
jgi:hypothetical protein